jgi:hypothetical protein
MHHCWRVVLDLNHGRCICRTEIRRDPAAGIRNASRLAAMAESLCEYRTLLRSTTGRVFSSRAWGAEARDGTPRWNGWLEFIPIDGGAPVSTGHETTQSNRTCTLRWAQRLSGSYLEGALGRALKSPPGQAVPLVALAAQKRVPDRRTSVDRVPSALGELRPVATGSPDAGGRADGVRPPITAERAPRKKMPRTAQASQAPARSQTATPPPEWPRPLNAWDRWLLKSLGISTQ